MKKFLFILFSVFTLSLFNVAYADIDASSYDISLSENSSTYSNIFQNIDKLDNFIEYFENNYSDTMYMSIYFNYRYNPTRGYIYIKFYPLNSSNFGFFYRNGSCSTPSTCSYLYENLYPYSMGFNTYSLTYLTDDFFNNIKLKLQDNSIINSSVSTSRSSPGYYLYYTNSEQIYSLNPISSDTLYNFKSYNNVVNYGTFLPSYKKRSETPPIIPTEDETLKYNFINTFSNIYGYFDNYNNMNINIDLSRQKLFFVGSSLSSIDDLILNDIYFIGRKNNNNYYSYEKLSCTFSNSHSDSEDTLFLIRHFTINNISCSENLSQYDRVLYNIKFNKTNNIYQLNFAGNSNLIDYKIFDLNNNYFFDNFTFSTTTEYLVSSSIEKNFMIDSNFLIFSSDNALGCQTNIDNLNINSCYATKNYSNINSYNSFVGVYNSFGLTLKANTLDDILSYDVLNVGFNIDNNIIISKNNNNNYYYTNNDIIENNNFDFVGQNNNNVSNQNINDYFSFISNYQENYFNTFKSFSSLVFDIFNSFDPFIQNTILFVFISCLIVILFKVLRR